MNYFPSILLKYLELINHLQQKALRKFSHITQMTYIILFTILFSSSSSLISFFRISYFSCMHKIFSHIFHTPHLYQIYICIYMSNSWVKAKAKLTTLDVLARLASSCDFGIKKIIFFSCTFMDFLFSPHFGY